MIAGALVACGPAVRDDPATRVVRPVVTPVAALIAVPARDGARPLLIDPFEVTNGAFAAFLDATGHEWAGRPDDWLARVAERPDHPVTRVSFGEASAFAAWWGGRLPTASEWLRAARGARDEPYPWGSRDPVRYAANTLLAALDEPAPVGAFPSSRTDAGIQDLIGNVWEWTDSGPDAWTVLAVPAPRTRTLELWFPRLLPGYDGDPSLRESIDRASGDAAPPRRVPYVGAGRVILGGSFRHRAIAPPPARDLESPFVYESVQGAPITVEVLERVEWRDDLGFRCVRDVDDTVIAAMLDAMRDAPPVGRDRIAAQIRRLGRDVAGRAVTAFDAGRDADLARRCRTLWDDGARRP